MYRTIDKQIATSVETMEPVELKDPILEHPIPCLEIMNKMVKIAKENNFPSFENIAFIGAQHKLETTASLLEAIIKLGANPKNMFFTGKCYSTCPSVEATIKNLGIHVLDDPKPLYPGGYSEACTKTIKKMWKSLNEHLKKTPNIEKIIILDDGGRVVEELKFVTIISYQIIVIEQTKGGLYSKGLIDHGMFPMISVAQSAAKKIIEAPLIATAILIKLKEVIDNLEIKQSISGVVGNGSVGKMVANYLADIGHEVKVYDQIFTTRNHKNIHMVNNIEEIFNQCSFIFGCTGRDITENLDLETIVNDQIWISGSSEDREFRSFILSNYRDKKERLNINPMNDLLFELPSGKKVTIKQGGFPFNFDKKPWNVPAKDIEVTQCCLLGAVMQAGLIENNRIRYKIEPQQQLNSYIQSFIVTLWGEKERQSSANRFDQDTIDKFKIPNWIEEKSGRASCVDIRILREAFQMSVDLNTVFEESPLNMRKFMEEALLFMHENSQPKISKIIPTILPINKSELYDSQGSNFHKLDYKL